MARARGSAPLQERSAATRLALLDAAVACIAERGFAAATTSEVAARAGVSRGAQLHHFPSRAALMAAALEHVLDLRINQACQLISQRRGPIDVPAAIAIVWKLHQGAAFVAYLEMWLAARTDSDLAEVLIDVERRFTDATSAMWVEHVTAQAGSDPHQGVLARDVVFAVIHGVAFQRLVPRGQRPATDYLDELTRWVSSMLGASAP